MPKSRGTKFIFVTGGVVSSLGKGITAASIAALLESRNLTVSLQKLDPYINVDPGTMNPLQHGEVYVTDDGCETDLDLGHYERFSVRPASRRSNYTTGQIYKLVLDREREGKYLGKTVQVIPHITDTIKEMIVDAAKEVDLGIIEIGGTVGDIESLPFLEAIRQMRFDMGDENVCYAHLTYVPYLARAGEVKTKPTQHSVRELRAIGIQPDILVCRSEVPLSDGIKEKISLFCDVPVESVISAIDADSIYKVPVNLHNEGIDEQIIKKLNIWTGSPKLKPWLNLAEKLDNPVGEVTIAVVGKYVELAESYKSLHEALLHAGIANDVRVRVQYANAEELNGTSFAAVDGILVPGGFGARGVEGKISAVQFARENSYPFFGICLGMQCAVIEYARHVVGLTEAHSSEFSERSTAPVISLMEEQKKVTDKGGTMRLGGYPCTLQSGSLAAKMYGRTKIRERHRHRYEFNNEYRKQLEAAGLIFSGLSPNGELVEIIEIKGHPWFLGCQFHPEFLSRPFAPHPLFVGFIAAAQEFRNKKSV